MKPLRSVLVLLVAGSCALGSLVRWETEAAARPAGLLSVPPAAALKLGSMGFRNMAADALYLRFIGYWGYQLTHGRNFHNLYPLLSAIVELDPRFHAAYELGALALGDSGESLKAVDLLAKGAKHDPTNWWFPYQAGMTLFFFGDDPLLAAKYFERAAELPGAPPEAGYFAARMYERGARTELAVATWRAIYLRADNPSIREVAKRSLEKLGEPLPAP